MGHEFFNNQTKRKYKNQALHRIFFLLSERKHTYPILAINITDELITNFIVTASLTELLLQFQTINAVQYSKSI